MYAWLLMWPADDVKPVQQRRTGAGHALAGVHVAQVLQAAALLFQVVLDPVVQALHLALVDLSNELYSTASLLGLLRREVLSN